MGEEADGGGHGACGIGVGVDVFNDGSGHGHGCGKGSLLKNPFFTLHILRRFPRTALECVSMAFL